MKVVWFDLEGPVKSLFKSQNFGKLINEQRLSLVEAIFDFEADFR